MKISIIIMLFIVNTLGAQKNTKQRVVELDSVKINTTKSMNSINNTPFPVRVINSQEIFLTGNNSLNDIIKKQTGIAVNSTRTGTEGVQIQGLDASFIPILIDGLPLIGRSFGVLDLKRINLTNVEKIEILKGASSSFYGSNAIGGVINIITKESDYYGSQFFSNIRYMTNNTFNPSLSYSYKNAKFNINNNFNYHYTDGFDLITTDLLKTMNSYYNYNISSNVKYNISNSSFFKSNFRFFCQEQQNTADSFGQLLEGESLINELNTSMSFKHYFNKKTILEFDLYFTNYKTEEFLNDSLGNFFDDNFFNQTYVNRELKLLYKKNKNLNLFLGAGITNENLSREGISFTPVQKLNFIYSQVDFKNNNKIEVILGSRYDRYVDYNYQISHNFASGFNVNKNIKLKTSFGTGFKIPDFRQRYFNFTQSTVGYTVLGRDVLYEQINLLNQQGLLLDIIMPLSDIDNNLYPESSFSINIGAEFDCKSINISSNFFINKIKNLIEPQIVAYKNNSLPIFSYFNINEVITKGIELNIDWDYNNSLSIGAGYQLLFALDVDVNNEFEEGNIYARDPQTLVSFQLDKDDYKGLFNRSRHMLNIKGFYTFNSKTKLIYNAGYISSYATKDSNDNGVYDTYDEEVKGYILHDFGITYKLTNTKIIQLGCNNILDFTNPQNISNISGRIFYINFKTNFLT